MTHLRVPKWIATDPDGHPAGRPIVWIGSSKQDVSALPAPVKASFGHRLHEVQEGKTPRDSKPLPAIGAGVLELRERFYGNAFRTIYVVSLKKAV